MTARMRAAVASDRFRRRKLGLASLALLLFIVLVGLLAQYDAGHEFLRSCRRSSAPPARR